MLPTLLLFIIVLSEPPHEACCQLKYIYCILCIYSTCTQEEKIFRILEKNLYAVFHNRFLFDTTEQLQVFLVQKKCAFFSSSIHYYHFIGGWTKLFVFSAWTLLKLFLPSSIWVWGTEKFLTVYSALVAYVICFTLHMITKIKKIA